MLVDRQGVHSDNFLMVYKTPMSNLLGLGNVFSSSRILEEGGVVVLRGFFMKSLG